MLTVSDVWERALYAPVAAGTPGEVPPDLAELDDAPALREPHETP